MLRFKTHKQAEEYEYLHPQLKVVLQAANAYSIYHFSGHLMITSTFRATNKSSVHYYGRGADCRSRDLTPNQCWELRDFINDNFPYRSGNYDTCLYHKVRGGVRHLHFQVSAGGGLSHVEFKRRMPGGYPDEK